jgi:hypothetical protein
MLPRSEIKTVAHILFLAFIFATCSNISTSDQQIITALNESIENSNKNIAIASQDVLVSLNEKTRDRAMMTRANYWYPKAELIHKISQQTFEYIEILKRKILNENVATKTTVDDLFQKLAFYKTELFEVDSLIQETFRNFFLINTRLTDSAKGGQANFYEHYFKNTSGLSASAVLTKLQNNIRINEKNIINFCHEQTGKVSFGPCSPDLPIVVQNSTIVQPGEKIEITTGICSFYTDIQPQVFIYEKPVPFGTDGLAIAKFSAASKPGKYYIPVRVKYTDQNGKMQEVHKEMQYTVANIQKN